MIAKTKDHYYKGNKNESGAALVVAMLFMLVMTLLGMGAISSAFMEEKMVGNSIDRERAFQAAEATLRLAERHLSTSTNKKNSIALVCGTEISQTDPCNRSYDESGNKIKYFGDDLGDECAAGYCTPREQDVSFDMDAALDCSDGNYIPERWQTCPSDTLGAAHNMNLFITAGKYQEYPFSEQLEGLSQAPRYIIEFLGYRTPEGEVSNCDSNNDGINDTPATSAFWPFCITDMAYFRVTALAYGGSVNTNVMLQSTVLID